MCKKQLYKIWGDRINVENKGVKNVENIVENVNNFL